MKSQLVYKRYYLGTKSSRFLHLRNNKKHNQRKGLNGFKLL